MMKLSEEEKKVRKRAYSKAYCIAHWEERRAYERAYDEKNKEKKKAWRAARKEEQKIAWEIYYAANKEKIKARRKEKKKEQAARYNLKSKYGLTPADYEQMLGEQDGRCKICSEKPGKRILVVDHNHSTKKVRSLLCHRCNAGLGMFKDSLGLLLKATAYLEENA